MSEVKKIATRESYGNALVELGAEHDNLIVLDADLAAATKTGVFKKAYPDRHIDCGIAECSLSFLLILLKKSLLFLFRNYNLSASYRLDTYNVDTTYFCLDFCLDWNLVIYLRITHK